MVWGLFQRYCLYWLGAVSGLSIEDLLRANDQLNKRNAELEQRVTKLNLALGPHGSPTPTPLIRTASLGGTPLTPLTSSPAGAHDLDTPLHTPRSGVTDSEEVDSKLRAVLSKLQKDNARLQRENSSLQRQLHSSRESEAAHRRHISALQAEVAKLKALNDQTAAETSELLSSLSALRQSQSQLAGDLQIKEEMLELVQQQLSEVAASYGLASGPLPAMSSACSLASSFDDYAGPSPQASPARGLRPPSCSASPARLYHH